MDLNHFYPVFRNYFRKALKAELFIPQLFIGVAFAVKAGEYPNGIFLLIEDEVQSIWKSLNFQSPDIFIPYSGIRIFC